MMDNTYCVICKSKTKNVGKPKIFIYFEIELDYYFVVIVADERRVHFLVERN